MLTKTSIALAATLILGTASAVLAADSGENNPGGARMPGSTDGVNPVDHRNNPAVQQAPRQDTIIRTEGRGLTEQQSEREQKEEDKERK